MEFQNSCNISDSAKFSKNLEIPHTNELTEKHDKLIDIHIDETGDPHSRFIAALQKAVRQTGFSCFR